MLSQVNFGHKLIYQLIPPCLTFVNVFSKYTLNIYSVNLMVQLDLIAVKAKRNET